MIIPVPTSLRFINCCPLNYESRRALASLLQSLLGMRWDRNERALRERMGTQLQEAIFPEKLTVTETIRLFRSFYRTGITVDAALDLVALREKRDARVKTLSGGQRQRLALATALVGDPEILFLDEPTAGLDPQSRRQLWAIIGDLRSRGRTVLLTTHYMEEAERLCDRVAVIDHGAVIALGAPRELIASLGAEHVVEFGMANGRTLDPATLSALPGVRRVQHEDGRLRLTVVRVHEAVPALMGLLEREGIELTDLVTHHATLEDVFLELTGRTLRDD